MNLIETYSKRLSVSEAVYGRDHDSRTLNEYQKFTIAKVLANTSTYLKEKFSNSVGTQRADMGEYKKFCLDLTTLALPNLIANDLVMVQPMSAITGYVQYLKIVAGSNKGGVKQGDVFNDPFRLGQMSDGRVNYTAAPVVELVDEKTTEFVPAWTPVVDNKVIGIKKDDGKGEEITLIDGKATITANTYSKIKYLYDNAIIPQNDIPTLNAKMDGIFLKAKERRLAIFYSLEAAFQLKTEVGEDLGGVLSTQAVSELSFEIDNEVVDLLNTNAETPEGDITVFNKHQPVGVGKEEHYAGFAEIIESASQVIYDKTQRYGANYMVIASNVKPILSLMRGWKGSAKNMNGPYFAGTLNGLKVYVSARLAPGRFFLGYNGDDLKTSAAIFAPFMAIVPTTPVQGPDGGTTQGFATLYDLQILNKDLLVAGKVIDEEYTLNVSHS